MCSELKALELAYLDTSSQFDDANGLMMGDFNAACRYQHVAKQIVTYQYDFPESVTKFMHENFLP